jgi:hypothetical protein
MGFQAGCPQILGPTARCVEDLGARRRTTPFNPLYVVQGSSQGKNTSQLAVFRPRAELLAQDLDEWPKFAVYGEDSKLSKKISID